MSVAKKFRILAATTACAIAALVVLLAITSWSQKSLNDAQFRRQESYRLSVLLRQTSDDLTRLVRSYVVTANPVDEREYQHIDAVQGGREPWPDGRTISLRDRMRNAGMTSAELAKLEQADKESNDLVAIETAAFGAVKGVFDDGSGHFTKQGAPDPELARRLVHDEKYNAWRDRINKPIEEFERMLDARTAEEVRSAQFRCNVALALTAVLILATGALVFFTLRNVNVMLRNTADHLERGAQELSSAAGQVASSSQVLAKGSSEQAASLEETSATAEEVRSTAESNARSAQAAYGMLQDSKENDEEVDHRLAGMTTSMNEITQSSEKISRIIRTVEEIAFQTNLLALNAAVEAARAGDAGMGFAVVADEVRNLARRASDAAKETSALIEEAIRRTSAGQEQLQGVLAAMQSSRERGHRIAELIQQVNAASAEQATGVDGIAKAVHQMQQVTQQTAATAEEASASSEELTSQSQAVLELAVELRQAVGGGRSA